MAVQRTQDKLTALLNAATADFPQAWKKAEWARGENEAGRLADWPAPEASKVMEAILSNSSGCKLILPDLKQG